MDFSRPDEPTGRGDSFLDPEDRVYDLGLIKVTLHKERDEYNSSVIRLSIDSERESLLEPNYANHSQQPSEADKIIALTKLSMIQSGMTLLDGKGGPANPRPNSMPENRVKLALMEFASYKPGSSGITIRAEKGYYPETFSADAMMHEAGAALERIAGLVKESRTVEHFSKRIDKAYDDVDLYNRPLDDALCAAAKPDLKPAPIREKRSTSTALSLTPEHKFKQAIERYIPKEILTPEQRSGAVEKIAKGVLCAGEACWTKGDKLKSNVHAAIVEADPDNKISDNVKNFIVGEICDTIKTYQRSAER